MVDFAPEVWTAVWLVIAAAVLAMLHALSAQTADDIRLHRTRARAAMLKAQYVKRLAEQEGVIEVDEAPLEVEAAAPERRAA